MKKHVVKNSRFPVVLVASFFLFILAGFLYSKPFKIPKEVKAVVGELNIGSTGAGAQTLGDLKITRGLAVGSYDAPTTAGNAIFSGNVGIGTTAPASKLHLYDASVNNYLTITAPLAAQSSISFGDITNGQDSVLYRPGSTRDLRIYTTTAGDVVSVTQAGNVGIGTTGPTLGKLQVNGGSGVAIRSDSSGPNATIYGVNSSVSGVGVTGYGSANGGIGVYGLGTGNGWDFYGAGPKSYFAGTVTASGVINASGGNSTQWNAASTGYGAVKVALVQNSAATTCQSRCATKYGSTWGCSVATAWAGGTNPAIGASYISCSDTTTTYKICTCFNFDYSL